MVKDAGKDETLVRGSWREGDCSHGYWTAKVRLKSEVAGRMETAVKDAEKWETKTEIAGRRETAVEDADKGETKVRYCWQERDCSGGCWQRRGD